MLVDLPHGPKSASKGLAAPVGRLARATQGEGAAVSAYLAICACIALGLSGLPVLRYGVYTMPLWAFLAAVAGRKVRFEISRHLAPFVLLVGLGAAYAVIDSRYGWKWTTFVVIYVTTFIWWDFSKIAIDARKLFALFLLTFGLNLAITGVNPAAEANLEMAFVDSTFGVESTYSFCFGILAAWFLLERRYLWALVSAVMVVLTFKRIVILALLVFLILRFTPASLRRLVLNPVTATVAVFVGLVLGVEFALGHFDDLIMDATGYSADYLTKGRRWLWAKALDALKFSYGDFVITGLGLGKILGLLTEGQQRPSWVLLHNDFLLLYLAYGALMLGVFAFAVVAQKSVEERLLSVVLYVFMATDNVLIYQHVMVLYLLALSQARRLHREQVDPAHKIPKGVSTAATEPAPDVVRPRGIMR